MVNFTTYKIVFIISIFFLQGIAVAGQFDESIKNKHTELKQNAVSGEPSSKYRYFIFVAQNDSILGSHMTEALTFLIEASNAGHIDSLFTLGSLYQTGLFVDQNLDLALDRLLIPAQRGHKNAQNLVANNYANRYTTSNVKKEQLEYKKKAIFWYEKSLDTLSPSLISKRQYGEFLMYLDDFSQKAESLLRDAATNGDLKALNSLGLMYSYRWDTTGDLKYFKLAQVIFEKAVSLGEESSIRDLKILNASKDKKVMK